MTVLTGTTLSEVGIDAAALKPTEIDLDRARQLDVGTLTIDYEGRDYFPESDTLRRLASEFDLRVTVPFRADGFDPQGDDSLRSTLPGSADEVLVAGHPAYLDGRERERAVAPRLSAAVASAEDPWIGTEGIERLALAAGGTQFELLSGATTASVRGLRAAGFDGEIAVYAPTVLAGDESEILDAVGAYAARRNPVRERLPDAAPTDSTATGPAREVLSEACREYALVGAPETVSRRVSELRAAGVDYVVGYPARGLDPIL
jgi:hypothetical protein